MARHLEPGVFFETAGGCALGRLRMAGVQRGVGGFGQPRRFGEYALVYSLGGLARYWDERGHEQDIVPGDLIVVFPEIAHVYGPREGARWDSIYLVFDGPVFELWRREGLLDPEAPVLHVEPVEYWMHRFEELLEPAAYPTDRQALVRIGKLQVLLAEILAAGPSVMSSSDAQWLAKARALIVEQPVARVDWQALCRELGTSYESFRKRFRRLAGVAPGHYQASCLVERACQLLYEGGRSVAEIADELGFCDAFHFSRRFRQITGFSPTDFRRKLPSIAPPG